jgi:hypothetical protein
MALLKTIGARSHACCWHVNGDDNPHKESSLAHLLGASQVEMELIVKMCGCFDDKEGLLALELLNQLVDAVCFGRAAVDIVWLEVSLVSASQPDALTSQNSSRPQVPPSRPLPLPLTLIPPKGEPESPAAHAIHVHHSRSEPPGQTIATSSILAVDAVCPSM